MIYIGIVHCIICVVGLAANILSIPVLKSKELYKSTFNRLLIVLAIIDNLYLTFALLEIIRTDLKFSTDVHTTVFVHALYPLHNVILCLSIYMTVTLAMERYRAVSKPIDYHTIIVSGRQWQRVFHYVIPVVIFSLVFNLPKFMELKTQIHADTENSNATSVSHAAGKKLIDINCSFFFFQLALAPTELRLNDYYTIHYNHNLRIIFTGAIPLVTLVYFNYRIYSSFKQRRQNVRGT